MALISNSVRSWFLTELASGMGIIFKHMFHSKATLNYPHEKGAISSRFRGEHALRI